MARVADCPLGRTVDAIGGWWALEVLHEVLAARTRPETIADALDRDAGVVAERLTALVDAGLLRRDERGEHIPTEDGLALRPLLLLMAAWGNRGLPAGERSVVLVDPRTGREVDPVLVDSATGEPADPGRCVFAAGPAASAGLRARYPDALA